VDDFHSSQVEEPIGKSFEGSVDKFVQKLNVRERVDALQQKFEEPSLARGMTRKP